MIEVSVVVPVRNESKNLPEFLRRTVPVLASLVADYEIIFAVDPSTDGTEEILRSAHEANKSVKMISFSRRFGQPAATLAGLDFSTGKAVIVMDVDLQDPPELLAELVKKWHAGFDVVYAQRNKRSGETFVKRLVSNAGYRFLDRWSDVDIPRNTGDFRLMDRKVVDTVLQFPEAHGFLRGLVALAGFHQTSVTFDRPARYSGKGAYNRFFGSLRIGLNGIIGFSTVLLSLSTVFGLIVAMLGIITAVTYAAFKVAGTHFPLGNPTIVILVLLLGSAQLICLGIIGQYVGRIYEEVKRRPRFIVAESVGFSDVTLKSQAAKTMGIVLMDTTREEELV